MHRLGLFIATCAYIGYAPVAPGTFGSAAGLVVFFAVRSTGSVGLELAQAGLIFVKSPSHFRATFGPYADRILTADTPGATRVNIRQVAYKNVIRPIHPLDAFA